MYMIYDVWITRVLGNSAAVYVFADCFWPNYESRCEIALAWFRSFRRGGSYHWVAGEGRLQFEDLVETNCLCLCKLLLCHAHQKLHCGVGVVFLIVADQRRSFICSLEHGLQNWLLICLDGKKDGISGITSVPVKRSSFINQDFYKWSYLSPGANRKFNDLNGIFVQDRHFSADHILVLSQLMNGTFEVLVPGQLTKTWRDAENERFKLLLLSLMIPPSIQRYGIRCFRKH